MAKSDDAPAKNNEQPFSSTQLLISPVNSLGRAGRIRQFLKTANQLLVVLGIIWGVFALFEKHYALFIADVLLVAIGGISYALLRSKRILVAIHWLLLSLLFWVVGVAHFISGSGVNHNGAAHYWLIVYIVGLHFVLFGAARVLQTAYVASAILIFILVEYDLISLNPKYGFPSHDTLFSHGLTLGLVLIAVAILMRRYILDLDQAEKRARAATIRSNELLNSVLPPSVAQRVQREGSTYTQSAENCTILFADIVGFTPLSERLSATELVSLLNQIFGRFDQLTVQHGVEKIKTIGDGYMVVCGIPKPDSRHAHRIIDLAQDMLLVMNEFDGLSIRIGINTGTVIAGIIGQTRIAFDLWGRAVNIASRMESHGENARIQVTEDTYSLLRGEYQFDAPRIIDVKGKGEMRVFFLAN